MLAFLIIISIALVLTILYAYNADKAHKRKLSEIVNTLNDEIKKNEELVKKISKMKQDVTAYELTLENYEILKKKYKEATKKDFDE